MHWVKRILAVLLALVVIIAVVGLLLPAKAHVERSLVIQAPATTVFPYVNNYRLFNTWSPWAKKDPNTRYTFSGPESGVGAKMSWSSKDENVGKGSQEIIESVASQRVRVSLDFDEMGKASATYTLQPQGNATRLTWAFDEDFGYNLLARYFGLLFEKFIGPDYEQGLANLKAELEGAGKKQL